MSVLVRGIAAACVLACGLAPTGAAAQTDLTAGKTPAQMFSSDCAACHRSPSGLSRGRDPSGVARFLRDHYTSSPANAGALAGYLAGAGGGAATPGPRGRQRPQAGQEERPDPRAGAAAAPGQRQPRQPPAETEAAPAPTPPQQRQAAPAPEGQPPAERPAPRRTNERLASTPLDRLRPYIAAHDPATPAPAGDADRQQRITDYATAGTSAEALRAAALAVRPAPAPATPPAPPVATPDAGAARAPEAADRAAPGAGVAAAPAGEASATPPGAAPSDTAPAGAAPAGEAPAEAPVAGPPVGSAAPTSQSNEDPR